MDIEFRGELTRAEALRAVRMLLRLSKRETTIRVVGAILVAVILFAVIVYDQFANGPNASRVISEVLSSLMIELVFVYPFINNLETERRAIKRLGPGALLVGVVSRRGIRIENPSDNWERAWEDFYRMRQSEDLMALKTPDRMIWVLSRSLFASESEWNTVKTWARNLVQEAK